MTKTALPVLITSAINVSANKTILSDADQRLSKTIAAIKHWQQIPLVNTVIVCDGSGFDLSEHISTPGDRGTQAPCEFLSFHNDQAKVRALGKGYGEGEIVKFALENSSALRDSHRFAKCTAKLWLSNFPACVSHFRSRAAFDYGGRFDPVYLDTRFYLTETEFFRAHLMNAYLNVDEDRGYNLEHAYKDALRRFKLSEIAIYPTPRIFGTSGSMNTEYLPHPFKSVLRDTRSLIVKTLGI